MGLDMYLYAEKQEYKSENYCYPKNTMLTLDYPPELDYAKNYCYPSVTMKTKYEIAYWRKANAVHKYFVDLNGGVDDCRPIEVGLTELRKLVSICEEIKNDHSKAKELLPTEDGFFFGSTDYDEWYFDDIDTTIKMLQPAIEAVEKLRKNGEDWVIIYRASW